MEFSQALGQKTSGMESVLKEHCEWWWLGCWALGSTVPKASEAIVCGWHLAPGLASNRYTKHSR